MTFSSVLIFLSRSCLSRSRAKKDWQCPSLLEVQRIIFASYFNGKCPYRNESERQRYRSSFFDRINMQGRQKSIHKFSDSALPSAEAIEFVLLLLISLHEGSEILCFTARSRHGKHSRTLLSYFIKDFGSKYFSHVNNSLAKEQ